VLDTIALLWDALNQHHLRLSKDFKQHYSELTFEKRKDDLLHKAANAELRIDVAVDEASGQNVGYCVSSFDKSKIGEIESIFVNENYRGLGIGDALMKKALAWMDGKCAEKKVVAVAAGNEQAIGFYGRYGFVHRKTVLEQAVK
jgi:ribosomal protein S18 acetylase RimI-like enzyme